MKKEEKLNVIMPQISETCEKCLYGNIISPKLTHCGKFERKPYEIYYGGASCPRFKSLAEFLKGKSN